MDQGAAHRTYGYISDISEMLFFILLHGKEPVYNVGGRSATTIRELAKTVGLELGVQVVLPPSNSSSGMTGAPTDVSVDLSRICDEAGKSNFVTLHDGLARCISWQRQISISS